MATALPRFVKMWNHYPMGSAAQAKQLIGGKVNAGWIDNTCAVRLSRSLNYGGLQLPFNKKLQNGLTLNTVSGADKRWYAFRVKELKQFLREVIGPPATTSTDRVPGKGISYRHFSKKQGIIVFEVNVNRGFGGHIDLWDGELPRNATYFGESDKVSLFELA